MLRAPAAASQQTRRSRRREETQLTESDVQRSVKRVRLTTKRSRAAKTKSGYNSYMNSVHEYYCINHPELCTDTGDLDAAKVREKAKTTEGLEDLAKGFKVFLDTRTHHKDRDKNGNPLPARVGSLTGYRSAFNYYVWTKDLDHPIGTPPAWLGCLKDYYTGLKNTEADKRQAAMLKSKQGKSKMAPQLFQELCGWFVQEDDICSHFTNTFGWNLMARHSNVESLHAEHLSFSIDAITIEYGKDKCRQKGGERNKSGMLKHVYANPLNPQVSVDNT